MHHWTLGRHLTPATVVLPGRGWAMGSTPLQAFEITQPSSCPILAGEHPGLSLLNDTFFWAKSYEVTLLSVSASNKVTDTAAEGRRLTTTDLLLQYKKQFRVKCTCVHNCCCFFLSWEALALGIYRHLGCTLNDTIVALE